MYKRIINLPGFQWIAFAGLLILLVQMSYQQNSANAFHFDDRYSITEHAPVHMESFSLTALWQAGENAKHATRPLPSVTFAFDWWRGGGTPQAFLQTNLLIHTINALLVMALLFMLLRRHYIQPPRNLALIAFISAAIWALHPIQVQGVSYIVQRMASLATLFTLLAVISYLLARESRHSGGRIAWFTLCLLAIIAGMMSKELAWIAPLLLLLTEYCVIRNRVTPLFNNRLDSAVLFVPIVLALLLAILVMMGVGALGSYFHSFYEIRDFTMEQRLLTQPRVILFHLSQVVWPLPGRFSLEHDFVISESLFDPFSTLLAILFIVAWCLAAVYLWRRTDLRIVAFLMLWIPAALSVESSFIGLEMIFEHRMYLPLFGLVGLFAFAMAYMINRCSKAFWPAAVLSLLLLSGLAASTLQRVPVWQSTESLLINSTLHAPNSVRSWSNLGRYYIDRADYTKARPLIEKALTMAPENASVLEAMGTLFLSEGKPVEAREYMVKAYRTNKVGHSWLNNMAWLHLIEVAQGLKPRSFLDKALDFSRQAQTLAPNEPRYLRMNAVIYEQLGQCREAFQTWRQYLQFTLPAAESAKVNDHLARHYSADGGRCLLRP